MTIMVPSGKVGKVRAFVSSLPSIPVLPPLPAHSTPQPPPSPAPVIKNPRVGPAVAANRTEVKRLIEEERAVVMKRQAARQETFETIRFHFRRGMSEMTLSARWGREAVEDALKGLREERDRRRIKLKIEVRLEGVKGVEAA